MLKSNSTCEGFVLSLLVLNKLSRFFCVPDFFCFSMASPRASSKALTLSLYLAEASLFVDTELRRLWAADCVFKRFALELLFVFGFDSLFWGLRGAGAGAGAGAGTGADCSFPMMAKDGCQIFPNSH
jgi:hypothetical protein